MPTYNIFNPAEHIQAPQAMSLGDMINVGRGIQALKTGGIELQKQEQLQKERAALMEFSKDPNNVFTDLGNGQKQIDLNKVSQFAMQNMPLSGNEYVQQMAATAQNTAVANTAQLQMGANTRNEAAQIQMSLANSGVTDSKVYFDALRQRASETNNPWLKTYADAIEKNFNAHAPQSGEHVPQAMLQAAQSTMSVQDQTPQAGTITTPQGTFQTTTTLVNGKPQLTMGNMIAPAQAELLAEPDAATGLPRYKVFNYRTNSMEVTTSPEAPEYKPQPGQFGMQGQQPAQPSGQPSGQPSTAATQLTDQFTSHKYTGVSPARAVAIEQGTNLMAKDREIAPNLPQQTDLSNQIISAALKTPTGGGAGLINALSGNVVAQNVLGVGQTATDLQTLGHNLALLTSTNAQNAGLGTDAGRQLAGEISGTTSWTPQAIIKTARMNRALTHATRLLINGRQNAVSTSGDAGAASDFSLKWGKTAKLDAIRLMDAYENKNQDPAGFAAIVQELGGNKSARYKQALKDSTAIETLVGQ